MISFLIYQIKLSICMLVAFIPYFFLMRKNAFFSANRAYLLSAFILSLIIPLIRISVTQVPVTLPSAILYEWMDEGTGAFSNIPSPLMASSGSYDLMHILTVFYFTISLFMFLRFSNSLLRLCIASRRSEVFRHNKMIAFISEKHHQPFSFFRFVFLSRYDFENDNNKLILIHEQAHLQCFHSYDLLLIEISQVIFWMSPMIIIYRRALRLQHEYQVDKIVLQKTKNYSGYLNSLARAISNGLPMGIRNGFYCSTLKKRIQMIGNKTSKKITAIRYFLILPFTLIMILAFIRPEAKKFLSIIVPSPIVQIPTNDLPSIAPIDENKARLGSGWGYRVHPIFKIKMFHYGIDWIAREGTMVYATADGEVETVDTTTDKSGLGHLISIKHSSAISTRYAHLGKIKVKKGDLVKKGQVIGFVGNTGRSSAPHLHYEVLENGKAINPEKFFNSTTFRDTVNRPDKNENKN